MREVTLEEVLAAREQRVRRQDALLARHRAPVISFTMNVPGPVKDTPLIRRAFAVGCRALQSALDEAGLAVAERSETLAPTGCELQCAVRGDALAVKRLCTRIEDADALGRLFDMDVLAPDGAKLDRDAVDGGPRCCIVCGAAGRGCASRRVHGVPELQAAARRILTEHFAAADAQRVSALVTHALLREVHTTPKPGLVDRANTGSHRDMDVATFERSAAALAPYWARCFALGRESAADAPEATFAALRPAGQAAERAMLAATGGVNTHKGAVFTLGVLCGALGRRWRADAPCRDADALGRECAAMTGAAMAAELAALTPDTARSAGQRLYLAHGLRGIRGEVADGLPAVRGVSLPAYRAALAAGCSENDAGVYALLALIARAPDTNMVVRGGLAAALAASALVRALLDADPRPPLAAVEALDRAFIAQTLSPGGCADLLAVTYFLDLWQSED